MNYYRTPVLKPDPKNLKGSQVKLSKFLGSSDDWFSDKNIITFDFFVEWDKDNSYSSPLNKNIFIKRCVNKQFYNKTVMPLALAMGSGSVKKIPLTIFINQFKKKLTI